MSLPAWQKLVRIESCIQANCCNPQLIDGQETARRAPRYEESWPGNNDRIYTQHQSVKNLKNLSDNIPFGLKYIPCALWQSYMSDTCPAMEYVDAHGSMPVEEIDSAKGRQHELVDGMSSTWYYCTYWSHFFLLLYHPQKCAPSRQPGSASNHDPSHHHYQSKSSHLRWTAAICIDIRSCSRTRGPNTYHRWRMSPLRSLKVNSYEQCDATRLEVRFKFYQMWVDKAASRRAQYNLVSGSKATGWKGEVCDSMWGIICRERGLEEGSPRMQTIPKRHDHIGTRTITIVRHPSW